MNQKGITKLFMMISAQSMDFSIVCVFYVAKLTDELFVFLI